jgi:hypothetical protein
MDSRAKKYQGKNLHIEGIIISISKSIIYISIGLIHKTKTQKRGAN